MSSLPPEGCFVCKLKTSHTTISKLCSKIVESFTSERTNNEVVYNSSEKTEYPLRTIIDEVNSKKKFVNNYLFMKRVFASRTEKTTSTNLLPRQRLLKDDNYNHRIDNLIHIYELSF